MDSTNAQRPSYKGPSLATAAPTGNYTAMAANSGMGMLPGGGSATGGAPTFGASSATPPSGAGEPGFLMKQNLGGDSGFLMQQIPGGAPSGATPGIASTAPTGNYSSPMGMLPGGGSSAKLTYNANGPLARLMRGGRGGQPIGY